MELYEAIAQRILSLCIEKDMTIYQVAKKGGIPQSTRKDMVSGKSKNPGVQNLEKVALGFSLTFSEFMEDEIFSRYPLLVLPKRKYLL